MEVIGSGKHSSLLWYGNNYCRKKFYSTGPSREGISHQKISRCQSYITSFICNIRSRKLQWHVAKDAYTFYRYLWHSQCCVSNRRMHIRHWCRKTTFLNCHRIHGETRLSKKEDYSALPPICHCIAIEQRILDTDGGKWLSLTATDV